MGFPFDGIRTIVQSVAATVASLAGQAVSMLSLTLTQTTGNVGLQMTTGARLKLGGGTVDYLTSNGTTRVVSAGEMEVQGVNGLLVGSGILQINGANTSLQLYGNVTDGASAIANKIASNLALSTAGAQIAAFYSDAASTKQAAIDITGRYLDASPGNSTGAPGNATINRPSGRSTIAAAASTCVITNSLVSATSIVFATLQTADATATSIKTVIPTAGSFTITVNAGATGNTNFGWFVFNV
jgi:hypothetical protein